MFDQRAVLLKRGVEQRVPGHERDDVVRRRVELAPVFALGQLVDVGPQLPGVGDERGLPSLVVLGLGRAKECVERHLRIDDHVSPARQVDHHVWAETPVLTRGRHLDVEVAMVQHPGHLDDPAKLHLTPTAPGLRGPQRSHEVLRLLLQLVLGGRELLHLLGQAGVRPFALELHLPETGLVAAEEILQRVEQL